MKNDFELHMHDDNDLEDEEGVRKSVMSDSKDGLIISKIKTDENTSEYS